MDNYMATIGIFPLNIVLFPGSSYPLHIFESRYKELIGEVVAAQGEFGINLVLVEDGKMFQVGCGAKVSEVVRTYEDGKMDIIVSGTERYVVNEYFTGVKPYLLAESAPYTDTDSVPDFALLTGTINLYNKLIASVYAEAAETLKPEEWVNGGASFRIAQKSGLDLVLRQQLLEMRSENERLTFLQNYLTEVVPRLEQIAQIQQLMRNDGYVKSQE
jgi:ATP-dependent Lon protease